MLPSKATTPPPDIHLVVMSEDTVRRVFHGLEALREPASMKGLRLRTPAVRRLSQSIYPEVRRLGKARILGICEHLLETWNSDARVIAFDWAFRCRDAFCEEDFARFERWLGVHVDGWGSCDDLCTHALGALIYAFPATQDQLKGWTESDNRWFRRGAAVALIYSVRRHTPIAAFEMADRMLEDSDDLVQKGYGWLLKEVSKSDPRGVLDFVMARRDVMPRTAFRYAIEKLSPDLRRAAMARR